MSVQFKRQKANNNSSSPAEFANKVCEGVKAGRSTHVAGNLRVIL